MIDPDKLDKIRHKCDQAQGGYSGANERDYYRDVSALLADRDELAKQLQQSLQHVQALEERLGIDRVDEAQNEAAQLQRQQAGH